MQAACSDEKFIELCKTCESLTDVANTLGVTERSVYRRRRRLEFSHGPIPAPTDTKLRVPDDTCVYNNAKPYFVVIFSDCHWWPGTPSYATDVLIKLLPHIKPAVVIANGDVFDGAMSSRHPRLGWDQRPTIAQELAEVKLQMSRIEKAAGKAKLIRTIGNHDLRFDTKLAQSAPEFADVPGMALADHLPKWRECWAATLNDALIVKHRYKGGVNAAHNNVLYSGISCATGHTHRLTVKEFDDYRGNRVGIECGTLADIGPQFDYTEGNPLNWQSGFIVAHIDGDEVFAETVKVQDGKTRFWGKRWAA